MIYYIADTHFRDQSIFDKCKRPFKSLLDMEDVIVNNWNKRVKDDDIIYVLGVVIVLRPTGWRCTPPIVSIWFTLSQSFQAQSHRRRHTERLR